MTEILLSIVFFIIAISVLVTVHEYGHFWVARRLGVKVLRFSVGFGRAIWSKRWGKDDTEYVVAALPLGGYVQMLDEREGPVETQELARAFNRQPVRSRIAIVVAGPMFNFLLAIAAYWLVFVIGVAGIKPIVGEIAPASLAERGGFHAGDVIQKVAGKPTATWNSAMILLLEKNLDKDIFTVDVIDNDGAPRTRTLDFTGMPTAVDRTEILRGIGFEMYRPVLPARIGAVEPDGPAARSGLLSGDLIVAADNTPIDDWEAWVMYVRGKPGASIQVEVERDGRSLDLNLVPERIATETEVYGRIGAAVDIPEEFTRDMEAVERYSLPQGLVAAVVKTWDMTELTLRMLAKMVVGEVSVRNIGGPVRIAQYAGYSASIGFVQYVGFLALISISLGVLNLLPIPVLDGGHLMYYLAEAVKGSPVSEQTQLLGQRIGIAILVIVMVFALYNDLLHLFG